MRLAQKTTLGTNANHQDQTNKKHGGWVSNTTNSELDLTYAMPESIANVLGSAGFAEAARAFQHNNIGGVVPDAIRANLINFDEDEQQLQAAIDRASRDIIADAGNMNADSSVIAALALIGQSTTVSSVESARRKALDMIDAARDRLNNISDPDTPEEHLNRLWRRIDALTRQIDEVLDEIATPEERRLREAAADRLARAREEHRLAVESGDPARIAATGAELRAAGENVTQVDRSVTQAAINDGRMSPETGNSTSGLIDDRQRVMEEAASNTFGITNTESVGFSLPTPHAVETSPANNRASVNDSMADLNIPAAGVTPVAQNASVPAAELLPVNAELARFETADVALGDTGQFTPASASQPNVPAAVGRA